jgi:cytochrome b561
MAIQTPSLVVVALIPFIVWRLYSRFRRLVGRQTSRLWRHWTAAIFYSVLLLLLGVSTMVHPYSLAALAAGIAVGISLAIFGLKLTRFEATPQGFFYTPHAHIGIGLSLLLMLRVGYRFYEVSQMSAGPPPGMQDFARNPLTLVIIGMVASYYITYAIGLLRWRARTMRPTSAPSEGTP